MAVAGDGKPRSNQRKRTAMITIRATPREKQHLIELSRLAGYASLSAWACDRIWASTGLNSRDAILIAGWVGQVGTALVELSAQVNRVQHPDLAARAERLRREAPHMQKLIMRGIEHAGEGHCSR